MQFSSIIITISCLPCSHRVRPEATALMELLWCENDRKADFTFPRFIIYTKIYQLISIWISPSHTHTKKNQMSAFVMRTVVPRCCSKLECILTLLSLCNSSLALWVRPSSPLQLLKKGFFSSLCHSQASSSLALYSCSVSVMRNLADLISLVALLPRQWAGGRGRSCFCLVYKWQRYYSHKGSVSYHCVVPSALLPLSSLAFPASAFLPLLTLGWEYALILEFKACMPVSGCCVCLKLINDRSRLGVVLWRPASQVVHVNEQEREHTARRWSSATRRLTTAAHSLHRVHSLLSSSHVVNLPHLSILSEYPVVGCHENKKACSFARIGIPQKKSWNYHQYQRGSLSQSQQRHAFVFAPLPLPL